MKPRTIKTGRLVLLVVALLALSNGLMAWRALETFDHVARPGFSREAEIVGTTLAEQIARALELGVPIDRLVGMTEFLEPALSAHPSFAYLIMTDTAGRQLYAVGVARSLELINTAVPISTEGEVRGWLNLGVRDRGSDTLTAGILSDILTLFAVLLIATIALLLLMTERWIKAPLRAVEHLTGRIAEGDWSTNPLHGGTGEAGAYLAAVNATLNRVNEHRRRLSWKAAYVIDREPEHERSVQRIMRYLDRRYRFRKDQHE
ncbi:MAG: hypothetical protein WCF85_17100 [Rhodospirillaceae bacterium]